MPVLACGIAVALDIADKLCICLCGSIKTEAGLYLVVLQVAVDCLRASDNLHAIVLGCIVFSKHAGIGIGVVTTNDYNSLDVKLTDNFKTLLKLVNLLKLGTSGTNHVETARVAILVDYICCKFHVVMVYKTTRPKDKAIQLICRINLLYCIKDTTDDIVTTRCLTTRKDNADIHLSVNISLSRNKLYERHSIGVREHFLDFFLIANTLCWFAFLNLYGSLKALWQLWLVSSPFSLQKTLFHFFRYINS